MRYILGIIGVLISGLLISYLVLSSLPPSPPPLTPVPKLSKSEYLKLASQLQSQPPQAALATLSHLLDSDPKILRSCHALAHAIGHASFNKYKSLPQALAFQTDICGNGYLHGAIEQYLSTIPDLDPVATTICPPTDASCLHGLGHGFMFYTTNNLPQALAWCDKQTIPSGQIRCSEGVFMENFTTDQKLHPSLFLNPQDPTYICRQQPNRAYQSVCYFYAPQYFLEIHPDAYPAALAWCAIQPDFPDECARGVGSRLIKYNLKNIPFVEKICSSSPSQTSSCLSGAISYFRTNFNSREAAQSFCSQLTYLRDTCLHSL